jgi:myo-inositol catabolism protein IolC
MVYEGPVKWCSTRASYPAARGYNPCMALGYDGKLYILAFDHRGSFQKKMFGMEGDPSEEETERIADAKHLIFEGMLKAVEAGVDPEVTGVLVDEQFGAPKNIPGEAKDRGLLLAMPVEKSGQNEFDFEYGDDFGAHIENFDPHFSKVLVRFNPEGDAEMNRRQAERLKRLSDWLRERDRKFLFELLVPAEDEQLEKVGGDADRFDAELRPELMIRAIEQLQDTGIEADVWKIEGIETQEDCERIVQTARRDGRDGVICVVLGRGANDEKVDHWLRQGAPVEGYAGFAIGRTIWWDALKGFLDGDLERDEAAQQISDKYLRFVKVYNEAARETAAA